MESAKFKMLFQLFSMKKYPILTLFHEKIRYFDSFQYIMEKYAGQKSVFFDEKEVK